MSNFSHNQKLLLRRGARIQVAFQTWKAAGSPQTAEWLKNFGVEHTEPPLQEKICRDILRVTEAKETIVLHTLAWSFFHRRSKAKAPAANFKWASRVSVEDPAILQTLERDGLPVPDESEDYEDYDGFDGALQESKWWKFKDVVRDPIASGSSSQVIDTAAGGDGKHHADLVSLSARPKNGRASDRSQETVTTSPRRPSPSANDEVAVISKPNAPVTQRCGTTEQNRVQGNGLPAEMQGRDHDDGTQQPKSTGNLRRSKRLRQMELNSEIDGSASCCGNPARVPTKRRVEVVIPARKRRRKSGKGSNSVDANDDKSGPSQPKPKTRKRIELVDGPEGCMVESDDSEPEVSVQPWVTKGVGKLEDAEFKVDFPKVTRIRKQPRRFTKAELDFMAEAAKVKLVPCRRCFADEQHCVPQGVATSCWNCRKKGNKCSHNAKNRRGPARLTPSNYWEVLLRNAERPIPVLPYVPYLRSLHTIDQTGISHAVLLESLRRPDTYEDAERPLDDDEMVDLTNTTPQPAPMDVDVNRQYRRLLLPSADEENTKVVISTHAVTPSGGALQPAPSISSEVREISRTVTVLQDEVRTLRLQVSNQEEVVASHGRRLDTHETDIASIREDFCGLTTGVKGLAESYIRMETEMLGSQKFLESLTTKMDSR
ncbi:hypothetical protein EVG20_g4959 [Dentipellis fragilis]|uniref:Zn(2)-C6 fungal-type domain-containing protein n=1 Tax=Dentipellis fragilis TaxID=205917 RepID=A0A4Y9YYC5_9AGAM|nr:hypothetical protein EVG20_g4959 [Dentipellis fragilis]